MNEISKAVYDAFPQLVCAEFLRSMSPLVPLKPDTVFNIFLTEDQHFLTLVATDYADPKAQSSELKSISGEYEFEFTNLLSTSGSDKTIEILDHDDMNGDFYISMPYKNHRLYYYVANTSSAFGKMPKASV
ncbi:hypothetical protein H6796_01610 [Candidatus Nomurabacteria bacterium]|nr:hypothetical protein [Candidatus Nomurabacteria bacterium]